MGESRLVNLSILAMEPNVLKTIDVDDIISQFAKGKARRKPTPWWVQSSTEPEVNAFPAFRHLGRGKFAGIHFSYGKRNIDAWRGIRKNKQKQTNKLHINCDNGQFPEHENSKLKMLRCNLQGLVSAISSYMGSIFCQNFHARYAPTGCAPLTQWAWSWTGPQTILAPGRPQTKSGPE